MRTCILLTLLSLFLCWGIWGSKPSAAEEISDWERLRREMTDPSFYDKLDLHYGVPGFTDLNGKINAIEKLIEKADSLKQSFDKLIEGRESRKANLEFLRWLQLTIKVASKLCGKLPGPVQILEKFFDYYAEGIKTAVVLMEGIGKELEKKAILAAQLADLNFSLYPGEISTPEMKAKIKAIRRAKELERLARRARGILAWKIKRLKDKKTQFVRFAETDYPAFIDSLVQEVQRQAGPDGHTPSVLDEMLRKLKRKDRLVFERTDPPDSLAKQYSQELDSLITDANKTIEGSADYLDILRRASSICQSARGVLDAVIDFRDIKDDTPIRERIKELEAQIEKLRSTKVSFEGEATTYEAALRRFSEVRDRYEEMKRQAEGILTEAQAVLEQAKSHEGEVLEAWVASDDSTDKRRTRIPYEQILFVLSLDEVTILSADDVTQTVLDYPRSVKPSIAIPTVAVKKAWIEEIYTDPTGEEKKRKKKYVTLTEGGAVSTATVTAEPEGIVFASSQEVEGLRAGTATVTASTDGFLSSSFCPPCTPSPPYVWCIPSAYQALQRGTLEAKEIVEVHEYMGFKLDLSFKIYGEEVSEVNVFVPADPLRGGNGVALVDGPICNFIGPDGPYEKRVWGDPTSSNDKVVSPAGAQLWAGDPGTSIVTYSIVDDVGNTLESTSLPVTSNKVRVAVNSKPSELIPWEQHIDVHAGEIVELKVEIEGPADMYEYECHWAGSYCEPHYFPVALPPRRLEKTRTFFTGQYSANYLIVPADIRPGTWYEPSVDIYRLGMEPSLSLFRGKTFFIQVLPAKLERVFVKARLTPGGPDLFMPELHLFNSPGGVPKRVEFVPEGYFTDDLTTEVHEETKYAFLKNTELLFDPVWPTAGGTCSVSSKTRAVEESLYIYGDESSLQSVNAIKMYIDFMFLDFPDLEWPGWPEAPILAAAGEKERLRLNVETEGEVTDYECAWSLDPPVGAIADTVTGFVQGEEYWYSESYWVIPMGSEGQEVQVKAAVRLKERKIGLGEDIASVFIETPPRPEVNRPPFAAIHTPADSSVFSQEEEILFSGWGYDPEELELEDPHLVWCSDMDGEFGTGKTLPYARLSIGEHLITLTATDCLGASFADTVLVTIMPFRHSGDFNGDGRVWTEDFVMFVTQFGRQQGDEDFDPIYDLDGDGRVWTDDFAMFVAQFGAIRGTAKLVAETPSGRNVEATASLDIARKGSEITVAVSANGLTELASYGLKVCFDSEGVQFLGATEGDLLKGKSLFVAIPGEDGEVWVLNGLVRSASTKANGLLSKLHFRALSDAAIGSHIRIDELDLFDADSHLNSIATQGLEVIVAPERFALYQNYPNPGNPSTVISYALAEGCKVNLTVYNTLGQAVRTLVDKAQPANVYKVVWDARDDLGREVASGVYLYRIKAGSRSETKRMLLLR